MLARIPPCSWFPRRLQACRRTFRRSWSPCCRTGDRGGPPPTGTWSSANTHAPPAATVVAALALATGFPEYTTCDRNRCCGWVIVTWRQFVGSVLHVVLVGFTGRPAHAPVPDAQGQ